MVDPTKCPVCGKDVPDYRQENVRCSGCGCNLNAFRILDSIEQDSKAKSSVWKPVGILAILAAVIFALLYFTKGTAPSAVESRIALLEDSIAHLNEQLRDGGQAATASVATTAKPQASENADKASVSADTANLHALDNIDITAPADKVTMKDGKKIYVVEKGDSWWKISQKLYKGKIKDEDIAKINGRKATDQLEIGEELIVK